MQKTTDELMDELKITESMDVFVQENVNELTNLSLSEYLQQLLEQYGLDKSQVFERAGMKDNNYGYEIFRNDKKKVSRDKLIQICIGFPLSIEETQKALRYGRVGPLYPRELRDALILYGLKMGYNVYQLNELLFENGEQLFE